MSYSVRFYIEKRRVNEVNGLGNITNALKNCGKHVENPHGENYYEIKVEQHLLTHIDEFIPVEFRMLVKKVCSKVTLVTENYGRFGISGGDTRLPVKIGSSVISYENYKVMIVGTNIELMIKAYLLFCKYNGSTPDYTPTKLEQKLVEAESKFVSSLGENRFLIIKNQKLTEELDDVKSKLEAVEAVKNRMDSALREIMEVTRPKPSIFEDALAFIFDKDARTNSEFSFPNGNPMSVREAKQRGLIKEK